MTDTFLQFFPACLLFCTVAFCTVDSWQKEDARIRRRFIRRIIQARARIEPPADTRPLMWLDDPRTPRALPWQDNGWRNF